MSLKLDFQLRLPSTSNEVLGKQFPKFQPKAYLTLKDNWKMKLKESICSDSGENMKSIFSATKSTCCEILIWYLTKKTNFRVS